MPITPDDRDGSGLLTDQCTDCGFVAAERGAGRHRPQGDSARTRRHGRAVLTRPIAAIRPETATGFATRVTLSRCANVSALRRAGLAPCSPRDAPDVRELGSGTSPPWTTTYGKPGDRRVAGELGRGRVAYRRRLDRVSGDDWNREGNRQRRRPLHGGIVGRQLIHASRPHLVDVTPADLGTTNSRNDENSRHDELPD